MFTQDQQKHANIIITTTDGGNVEGKLLCGLSGSIESTLNNDSQFIQLRDENNDVSFISKSQITKIIPRQSANQSFPKLKVDNLKMGNWTKILGVDQNATAEQVKSAYHDLAKAYHPDVFSIDMPLEIKEYAGTMLSRINVAYEQYKSFKKAA